MTGYELYNKVCFLLGYYDFIQDNDSSKKLAFLGMINQITDDLKLKGIEALSDKMDIDLKYRDALIYGCAMLFSMSLKDSGCAKMYSVLYANKRSSVLSATDTRRDVLPKPLGGGT